MIEPKPLAAFETLCKEAIQVASETADYYIQSWMWFVIGWDEMHRGRASHAREAMRSLCNLVRRWQTHEPQDLDYPY